MISSVLDLREQARALEDTRTLPTALARVSGVSDARDLIVLLDEQVQVFHNAIALPPAPPEDRFLASLNYSRERNDYEIDVRRIIDEFEIEQNSELRRVEGRTPDQQIPLGTAMRNGDVVPVSLNGDDRDDLFLFLERGHDHISGTLFLSHP